MLREYQNNAGAEKYLITHHERDRETGFDYRGARFYNGDVGRFLSLDPHAAKYVHWSHYAYGADSPLRFVDPTGCDWDDWLKEAGDVVVGIGIGVLTNIVPGTTELRNQYTPSNPQTYNGVLEGVDNAAAVAGPAMIVAGAGMTTTGATGVALSPATGPGAPVVAGGSATMVGVGMLTTAVGTAFTLNAPNNIAASGEYNFGAKGSSDKTYQTYTKKNPDTGEVYSGRTSGNGTPQQNVAKRDANHHKNGDGFGPAKLDKSSSSKSAVRGREQQLIDKHGGAKSQGGTSGNAINGIGPKNPKKQKYLDDANGEFGTVGW